MKFNNEYASGEIQVLDKTVKITGSLKTNLKAHIIASNPPDKLANYSGSYLPFPSTEIAFENTINKHDIINNSFNVTFSYPNSYYCLSSGEDKIPPAIFFVINYDNKEKISLRIDLPDKCNLKTLKSRNIKNEPSFYDNKYYILPVATAEKTMFNYIDYKNVTNKA